MTLEGEVEPISFNLAMKVRRMEEEEGGGGEEGGGKELWSRMY